MADEKIRMPASFGGLTRYFEDYKSKIELKPEHVIFLIVVVILAEFAVHIMF
ncbi:preprotein translocase subunit Sec61beta [Candidatus Pacearchaeota archaeon]|nr:preprotein translocase subunit Sec61beta [Candidatus Pacearchaeota archaeon]